MFEVISSLAIAISSIFGGVSEAPLDVTIEPLVIEQETEVEFECQMDMPCAYPEYRISWMDDIAWCGDNYNLPGYYEEYLGCLDEVRDHWTTLHV